MTYLLMVRKRVSLRYVGYNYVLWTYIVHIYLSQYQENKAASPGRRVGKTKATILGDASFMFLIVQQVCPILRAGILPPKKEG